jgi:hypothetical protein
VNKAAKKRKIIDDDNINSGKRTKNKGNQKKEQKVEKKWNTEKGKLSF